IDKIKSVINDGDVLKENLYNFNGYKTINRYDIGVINFENYFKNTGTEIAFDYLSNLYDTGDAGESNFKVKQKTAIEYFVDTLKIKLLNDLKRMSEPSRDFNVGDSDGPFMRSLNKENAVLIINSKLATLNDF